MLDGEEALTVKLMAGGRRYLALGELGHKNSTLKFLLKKRVNF